MIAMTLYALGDERPQIHSAAFVHPEAVLIGEVHVGAETSIWPGTIIRADNGPIVIGARTSVQDGAVIHTQLVNQTRIGSDCVIGHLAHLEGCVLEDYVLIGSGAVVLERVVCRSPSLVGAGAVVSPGLRSRPGQWRSAFPPGSGREQSTVRRYGPTPRRIPHDISPSTEMAATK